MLGLVSLAGCAVLEPTFQLEDAGDGQPGAVIRPEFSGNDSIPDRTLRREIEDHMLDLSRDPGREASVFDAADDLAELYRGAGYPDVRVEYDELEQRPAGPDAPASADEEIVARFKIQEGPEVVVRELALSGNQHAGDEELLALWVRRNSGVLGLGRPLLVATELESFAAEIARLYRSRGFLDVEVSPPSMEREPGAASARVDISIEEGPRYTFGDITLEEDLTRALGADAPEPPSGHFAPRAVQDYALSLRVHLQRSGYPAPVIAAQGRQEPPTRRVHVTVAGEPGRRGTIGAIEVTGNEHTLTSVILSKISLRAGDRYDGAAEEEALRRLYLTGLFSKVRIDREWMDGVRIRLRIVVEEQDSRALEVMGGYGSYERLRGGVRLEERNVFGTGKQASVSGRVSQRGFRTDATATDPDFLLTGASLSLVTEYFRREEPAFTDEAFGTTLSLTQALMPGLTSRTGYAFRNRVDARTTVVDPNSQVVDFTEGRVFGELRYDGRDHPLFPRSGHEEFVAIDGVDPAFGADVSFLRARFGAAFHIPIVNDLRLVLRTEQGWLWPGEGSANVPLQERYFNGGENTVRSFREATLGPLDALGNPIGGEFRNVFSGELRVPLWKSLEGAAFADAGNVGRKVQNFGLSNLRFAVGAGLRLVLPIGPVRLDFAHNPDRRPGEKDWVVHFSVGYPF